jgi:Cu/Ag efflux pump CusA
MFGLMLSTLLTLVIVPVVYSLVEIKLEKLHAGRVKKDARISQN